MRQQIRMAANDRPLLIYDRPRIIHVDILVKLDQHGDGHARSEGARKVRADLFIRTQPADPAYSQNVELRVVRGGYRESRVGNVGQHGSAAIREFDQLLTAWVI